MKIVGIVISRCYVGEKEVTFMCTAHDLSSFGMFERSAVKESCLFLTRTITPRMAIGRSEIIEHEGYLAYSCRWSDGLAVLLVSDMEYPKRLAFKCLSETYKAFKSSVPAESWQKQEKDDVSPFKDDLKTILRQFKDPENFDELLKTQNKVDEVQLTMHKNIMQVLENQENLDSLVQKSDDLSETSKQMFQNSRKLKKKYQCCSIQ